MKTHKEMIQMLEAHLILADYPELETAVTNLILDAYKLHVTNHLPEHEKRQVIERIRKNEEEFVGFLHNGPKVATKLELVSGDR